VLAHILGEVDILCTVLLGVSSRTGLPISLLKSVQFDRHRAKHKLARFSGHCVELIKLNTAAFIKIVLVILSVDSTTKQTEASCILLSKMRHGEETD